MYSTTDFKRGLKILIDDKPWEIVEFQHFKPGKGGAMMRTKLRNILTGQVVDKTFRSGEKVGRPDIATAKMQYLYREGTDFIFMDLDSYEQSNVAEEAIGASGGYITEGEEIEVVLYNGKVIDLNLAANTILEVASTEPGVQGDRVSGATKPATMVTGLTVQVPLFINTGDKIKVDTRSGEYLGRE